MSSSTSACIIIAAYNAKTTLARAVRSALAEPEVTEVIVVDDASTDGTIDAARSADDGSDRLKILVQPSNTGPSAARNRAIAESTSAWIGILDADDFFLPGRIAKMLAFQDQADFIADNMLQVDERAPDGMGKSLLDPLFTPKNITFTDFIVSNITRAGRERGEMGFLKPLMRREFLTRHNLRYRESMRLGEDYELYTRALALGARFIIAPAQGYVSIIRANSLSGKHSETDLLNLRECDRTLLTDLQLTLIEKKALRQHYLSIDCRLQWRLLILAVKSRNIGAALATFLRPYPVPLYLLKQLWLEALKRISAL